MESRRPDPDAGLPIPMGDSRSRCGTESGQIGESGWKLELIEKVNPTWRDFYDEIV